MDVPQDLTQNQVMMIKEFISRYFDKLEEAHKIVSQAKRYVVDNWEKIEDWSELNICIRNNNNYSPNKKKEEYYFSKDFTVGNIKKPILKANPVKTLEVIYDEVDHDISVTINGEEWWAINDDTVCFIANHIEIALGSDIEIISVPGDEGPKMHCPKPIEPYLICSSCKNYNYRMTKSGMNPVYEESCNHETMGLGGRLIGKSTLTKTPDWCPYLKKGKE